MARSSIQAFMVILAGTFCFGIGNPGWATVILYEGFGDYSVGDLTGQNVGTSTIGLDRTTTWQNSSSVIWDVVPSGLAIGSGSTILRTEAGAVIKRSGSSVVAAKLDLHNYVGTLYASYLYNMDLSAATGVPNQAVFAVIGEGATTSGRRFRQLARNDTSSASPVGVNYINASTAGSGDVNESGETFLILSRFTRVGENVDANTPGVATLWALDSDQFDYFKSTDFADIDTAAVGSANSQVTGKATHAYAPADGNILTLNDSWHLQLGSGMARSIFVTFDEIRMGDSFAAVTPTVPEPAAWAMSTIAAVAWCAGRRRRFE